ncbi:MAG: hypothetical protein WKF86_00115 [Acidimicrobiales bacterium]
MADITKPAKAAGTDTPAPAGPHDEVVALSIRNDGSLDQHAPEIIGDEAGAIEVTKVQFAQMAVTEADLRAQRDERARAEADAKQDPVIEQRIKEHEAAVKAAEATAERVVKSLSR